MLINQSLLKGKELGIKPYKIHETAQDVINKDPAEPKVIVSDFDDVIVPTCYHEVELLQKHPLRQSHLDEYLDLSYEKLAGVYQRKDYMLKDYLRKDGVNDKDLELPNQIITETFSAINFYKNLKPTKYAFFLRSFAATKYCKKLYICSHTLSEEAKAQKVLWLKSFFGEAGDEVLDKVEYIATEGSNKGDAMKEFNIEWDSFTDDRLDCVYDMVLKAEGFGKEIIIPKYGYNQPESRLSKMTDQFNLQLFYVDMGEV